MVTYTYTVSASGPTTSIQSVINQIASEMSTGPTIDRNIEINIDTGNYAGFTIPNGILYPLFNTSYKLVIKASANSFPIIDFNYSSPDQVIGIDVGSGNPNVDISGIRVQFFAVGIRVGLNSHFPKIKNCLVVNNRNVGIFFDQCAESQAIQNVIVNGDYGIVTRLCKSSSIIHNTIFQNGAISSTSGKSVCCIWAELATDYGNGVLDSGRLHLIGNVAWNTTGRCLTLFVSDLENNAVVSNYNNWVKGGTAELIAVEDNSFYRGAESRPRVLYSTLSNWKQTGQDVNSKSDDPKFISPVKIRNSFNAFSLDLNILPVSPVLGMVPGFAFNAALAAQWLPNYVSSSDLQKDILLNNRSQTFTAAGANDKPSTSGFFGQDVFSNPIDLEIFKKCEVDPFSNILYKSIDLWFPKIKKGYFYSNEREYYLYSKKQTTFLGDLAKTTFKLPSPIALSKPIKIKINGEEIESHYYDIVGNEFILYHKDLEILTGEEEINIEAFISSWNGESFNYNKVLYRFKINEGNTKYFLPEDYVSNSPVVITDDRSYVTDSDIISNREFYLDFDTATQQTELVFCNSTNLVSNGQFDYYELDGDPSFWQASNAKVIKGELPYLAVAGPNVCSISDKGYIRNLYPVSTEVPYTYSFHAMSYGEGTIEWKVEFYDSNYDTLGVIKTGSILPQDVWSRYSMSFSSSGQDYNTIVPQLPYPCIPLQNIDLPARAASVMIEIKHSENPAYTGALLIDAVQYENTSVPTLYHRKPFYKELTIEYEGSKEDHYIDTHLSLTSVSNMASDGFLYIPEIPAGVYGGPSTPAVTTLHEWRWPEGRARVMPWARTKGKDKLRKRVKGKFSFIPDKKPEIISPVTRAPAIKDINITPDIPATFVGDANGVGITAIVRDEVGNPSALYTAKVEIFDYNYKYPGTLSKKSYGLKEQLSPAITCRTDNAGLITFTWIPPLEDSGLYKGQVPSPVNSNNSLDRICYIQTEYPVSFDNYSNVVIFNNLGQSISTVGSSPIKATYTPAYSSNSSNVYLRYPAVFGSVSVIVDSVVYKESFNNILEDNQFFVDYQNSTVSVKGRVANIYIEYTPSYVYTSAIDPYKIFMYYDKVFNGYQNNITVGYDFTLKLRITVFDPSNNTEFKKDFELIAQNKLIQKPEFYNSIGFEF